MIMGPDLSTYWVVSDFDNCVIIFVDLILVTVIPLASSYRHQADYQTVPTEQPLKRSSVRAYRMSSLDEVLCHPAGYKDFFAFLAKEWSTENLLFWKEVNEFKTLADPEERAKRAQFIYETYITENGIYQVNIPDVIRSKVRATVQQIGVEGAAPDVFDKAQAEIFHLMSTDSFYRFNKTEDSVLESSQVSEVSLVGRSLTGNGSRSAGNSYAENKELSPSSPYSNKGSKADPEEPRDSLKARASHLLSTEEQPMEEQALDQYVL
jgi:hypothetical protein